MVQRCKARKSACKIVPLTRKKFLANKYPEITTVPYDSYQKECHSGSEKRPCGRGIRRYGGVVNEWLKQNAVLAAIGDKVTDKDYLRIGMGIALGQKNTELQGKFNSALDQIKQDGTYAALYKNGSISNPPR